MCIEWVICVLSRYRELRVSVKIQAGSLGNCLVINRIVWCMAVSSALRMFFSPCSLANMLMFFIEL
jgi:hypothetical protein